MTIYALVNNLLSSPESHDASRPVWTLISQAAILQGGNPFFVPDFADRFEARTALAIKIGRLGKGIAPRFAHRYIEAVAPAILFVASDMLKNFQDAGFPWTQALSYDRALALGKFTDSSLEQAKKCTLTLSIESQKSPSEINWSAENLCPAIEETIAAISRDNALKMGDIILVGIAAEGPQVNPDMRAHLSLNGTDSLSFNIR